MSCNWLWTSRCRHYLRSVARKNSSWPVVRIFAGTVAWSLTYSLQRLPMHIHFYRLEVANQDVVIVALRCELFE